MIGKTILTALITTLSLSSNAQTATFKSFSYKGDDARFNKNIDSSKQFYNPILAGFYPDPSI